MKHADNVGEHDDDCAIMSRKYCGLALRDQGRYGSRMSRVD